MIIFSRLHPLSRVCFCSFGRHAHFKTTTFQGKERLDDEKKGEQGFKKSLKICLETQRSERKLPSGSLGLKGIKDAETTETTKARMQSKRRRMHVERQRRRRKKIERRSTSDHYFGWKYRESCIILSHDQTIKLINSLMMFSLRNLSPPPTQHVTLEREIK